MLLANSRLSAAARISGNTYFARLAFIGKPARPD